MDVKSLCLRRPPIGFAGLSKTRSVFTQQLPGFGPIDRPETLVGRLVSVDTQQAAHSRTVLIVSPNIRGRLLRLEDFWPQNCATQRNATRIRLLSLQL